MEKREPERGGEETGNTLLQRKREREKETGRLQQQMRQNNEAGEVERKTEREGGGEGPRPGERATG